jgi:hypothetical protein
MRYLTNQDYQVYGDDLINMTARAAHDAVAPELEDVKRRQAEIAQREQRLQNQMVFRALDDAMPDWRITNDSDVFKAWLSQQEELSGRRAWDLLLEAFHSADVPRILRFFRDFRAIGQAPAAQAQTPSVGGTPPRQQTPAPQNMSTAIEKFYSDVAPGKWRGREEAKNREEARLHALAHGSR